MQHRLSGGSSSILGSGQIVKSVETECRCAIYAIAVLQSIISMNEDALGTKADFF